MTRHAQGIWRAARPLAAVVSLCGASTACSSGVTGPDPAAISGNYEITGVRTLANGLPESRDFRFTIVSVDAQRAILDFTAGDVVSALPARDTAFKSGDQYTVAWSGNAQFNHSLTFRASDCTGNDIGGGGDVVAWVSCSIRSVP